jgi:Divergent InlB B-repeat domain
MLALAGLLIVSYFPLSRIRAANAGATILPSAGKPLVNLKTPQNLKLTYAGPADAVAALQSGAASPTALASADFTADGAMDVVAGYSTKNGGLVVLMRGNPDAFAPKDLTLYGKAAKGNVPPTFLPKAAAFTVPESPDLIATGDFNRDGYKDVLVASRGGALYLLTGDGHGNLLAPKAILLPGQVTALAVTPDAHVAVTTDGPNGPQLQILAPSAEGLTSGATYPLPARGDAVAWGSMGGGADLAVGAGANVVMFYNALANKPQTETVAVPFEVKGLALGDFIWDRDGRTEIAVLADDGSIHILQHGTLNTTPLTAAELPARQAAIRGHHTQSATAPNPTALGAWTVAKQLPYNGSAPSGPVSASAFSSPRLASSSTPDLMVLDAAASQLHILDTSGTTASPSADISFTGTPVAALALPQKINAGRDIVVLAAGQAAPMVVQANTILTFNVTTTADEDDAGACTNTSVKSGTGGDGVLSLREAICEANNNAPSTSTINIGNGTYSLTSLETGELQVDTSAGYNLTINGTGTAAGTVIQQTDGHDRIFEVDFALTGNNPFTIQNVTLHGGNCTNEGDCGFGGGAILAGGFIGDDLTLTNVVLDENGANPTGTGGAGQANGGAIDFETPGNLTITNSTLSNNTASGAGGAIEFVEGPTAPGNLSVTGSEFSSNTTVISGGGISAVLQGMGGETAATVTISGSTFTGNSVTEGAGLGGGIFAETSGTVTVSNSRFVGNTAFGGKGAEIDASTAGTLTNNWWGCNAGPGNTGCDSVEAQGGGTATFNPWLVLSISGSPSQILPSGTSTLTADLTHNSNGDGGFSAPNGTPVTFFASGTLGTVNPTASTITSGQATSTYTAGSTAGNDTSTTTVDNATVNTTVNILDSVTVATSPAGLSITVDGTAYTAPQTFNWVVGSSHTLNTTSPQNASGGTADVFSSWSDGGAQSHSVTAPAATTTYTANFTLEYQLTTQASPSADGSVTPASGNYYAGGATVPVTATANSGFVFTNWTSTGGSFDSTTNASANFTMPSAAATVTGNFVAAVTITITTSPANLMVSADGGTPVVAPLVESWAAGSTHTIATSSPQTGAPGVQYVFNNWSDSGTISHSITVPSTATTYTATFDTQYQLTTQASPSADGSVTPASGGYYAGGAVIPVTATANSGFQFNNWTSTGGTFDSSTAASTNFHMPSAPATVTGNFAVAMEQITITTSPANLLVSADGGTPVVAPLVVSWAAGSSHTIATSSPQNGAGVQNVWSSWSDGMAISHGITVPPSPTTYTATFNTSYQLTMVASPSADGSVTPPSGSYYAGGAIIPVTATANAGFQFTNWTSTGGTFDSSTSASTNFHMPSAPATVTGNFANSTVQITVGTSPAGLSFTVDGTTYTSTQTFTLNIGSSHTIATTSPQAAGAGVQYAWSSWSDSGAISHNITVPGTPTTYTASFSTQYQLTTQASPSADGTVTPASGNYYVGGATIPVTATANAGFAFTNWTSTGGTFDSSTSASTNFHMPSAPATVTGNFGTFTISATPPSETIPAGHSATYTITLTSVGGLTGPVSLTCSGNPLHSTCSISPSTVMLNGTATTTVKLMASQRVNHGTFTLTFTGTIDGITKSAQVFLTVK